MCLTRPRSVTVVTTSTAKFVKWLQWQVIPSDSADSNSHPSSAQSPIPSRKLKSQYTHFDVFSSSEVKFSVLCKTYNLIIHLTLVPLF